MEDDLTPRLAPTPKPASLVEVSTSKVIGPEVTLMFDADDNSTWQQSTYNPNHQQNQPLIFQNNQTKRIQFNIDTDYGTQATKPSRVVTSAGVTEKNSMVIHSQPFPSSSNRTSHVDNATGSISSNKLGIIQSQSSYQRNSVAGRLSHAVETVDKTNGAQSIDNFPRYSSEPSNKPGIIHSQSSYQRNSVAGRLSHNVETVDKNGAQSDAFLRHSSESSNKPGIIQSQSSYQRNTVAGRLSHTVDTGTVDKTNGAQSIDNFPSSQAYNPVAKQQRLAGQNVSPYSQPRDNYISSGQQYTPPDSYRSSSTVPYSNRLLLQQISRPPVNKEGYTGPEDDIGHSFPKGMSVDKNNKENMVTNYSPQWNQVTSLPLKIGQSLPGPQLQQENKTPYHTPPHLKDNELRYQTPNEQLKQAEIGARFYTPPDQYLREGDLIIGHRYTPSQQLRRNELNMRYCSDSPTLNEINTKSSKYYTPPSHQLQESDQNKRYLETELNKYQTPSQHLQQGEKNARYSTPNQQSEKNARYSTPTQQNEQNLYQTPSQHLQQSDQNKKYQGNEQNKYQTPSQHLQTRESVGYNINNGNKNTPSGIDPLVYQLIENQNQQIMNLSNIVSQLMEKRENIDHSDKRRGQNLKNVMFRDIGTQTEFSHTGIRSAEINTDRSGSNFAPVRRGEIQGLNQVQTTGKGIYRVGPCENIAPAEEFETNRRDFHYRVQENRSEKLICNEINTSQGLCRNIAPAEDYETYRGAGGPGFDPRAGHYDDYRVQGNRSGSVEDGEESCHNINVTSQGVFVERHIGLHSSSPINNTVSNNLNTYQGNTAQHNTAQHNTAQHSSLLLGDSASSYPPRDTQATESSPPVGTTFYNNVMTNIQRILQNSNEGEDGEQEIEQEQEQERGQKQWKEQGDTGQEQRREQREGQKQWREQEGGQKQRKEQEKGQKQRIEQGEKGQKQRREQEKGQKQRREQEKGQKQRREQQEQCEDRQEQIGQMNQGAMEVEQTEDSEDSTIEAMRKQLLHFGISFIDPASLTNTGQPIMDSVYLPGYHNVVSLYQSTAVSTHCHPDTVTAKYLTDSQLAAIAAKSPAMKGSRVPEREDKSQVFKVTLSNNFSITTEQFLDKYGLKGD